jgi:penicillin amidase
MNETIQVYRAESVTEEVIITRHGPIINNLAPDLAGEQPLSMRWTALEPDRMLDGIIYMNNAKNCVEFRESLRYWSVPIQNMVYADVEGNIGYSFPGKVPFRNNWDGSLPVPGWSGDYEWDGYIPFEKLPHLYNPPQGYIASANNRVVDDNYPYFLSRDYCLGDRAQSIKEMIEKAKKSIFPTSKSWNFDRFAFCQIYPKIPERIGMYDPEVAPECRLFLV